MNVEDGCTSRLYLSPEYEVLHLDMIFPIAVYNSKMQIVQSLLVSLVNVALLLTTLKEVRLT